MWLLLLLLEVLLVDAKFTLLLTWLGVGEDVEVVVLVLLLKLLLGNTAVGGVTIDEGDEDNNTGEANEVVMCFFEAPVAVDVAFAFADVAITGFSNLDCLPRRS